MEDKRLLITIVDCAINIFTPDLEEFYTFMMILSNHLTRLIQKKESLDHFKEVLMVWFDSTRSAREKPIAREAFENLIDLIKLY